MLFRPSQWVLQVMQLTFMSDGFKGWLLALSLGAFSVAWIAEKNVFPYLARFLGDANTRLRPNYRKKRREYKVLREEMGL